MVDFLWFEKMDYGAAKSAPAEYARPKVDCAHAPAPMLLPLLKMA